MKLEHVSIIREGEYRALKRITLDGNILDVGGGARTEYQNLINGEHIFSSINIDEKARPTIVADVEKVFPFADEQFNHAVCMNLLEHVFEFQHVVAEMARVVKSGGSIVMTTPFMYKIHGSPDDYLRYTESALRKLAAKLDLEVVSIEPIGSGFFSLGMQTLRAALPSGLVWAMCKRLAGALDGFFNTVLPGYKILTKQIPLGYVTIYRKK